MIDHSDIVQAIADGLTIAKTAERFGVTIDEVRTAIKEAVKELSDGDALRQEWMLEDRRLKAIGLKFYNIAMQDDDPQSAIVFLKASERRATLNGLNAPQSYSVQLMNQSAPVEQMGSIDKIEAAINRMRLRNRPDDATDEEEAPAQPR